MKYSTMRQLITFLCTGVLLCGCATSQNQLLQAGDQLKLRSIQTKAFDYNEVADQLPNAPSISSQFTNIIEGYFRFWQTTDCLSILWEDSPFNTYEGCYFQNPNAPYGLMLFPPHEEEVIDKYYGFPISDVNQFTGTWHLKETDVIVLLGLTPPTWETVFYPQKKSIRSFRPLRA